MKILTVKSLCFKESNLRLDSSFHLSDGRIVRNIIDKIPFQKRPLSELTNDIFYGGRAKRNYVKNIEMGVPFMGSSDMLKSTFDSLKFISKKLTKNLHSSMLFEGWTLISRSGTIGNTAYVNKDFIDKAASEHIIRIIPNEQIKAGYLYSFLTCKYGYALLTQGTFGAVIQHIEPDYLLGLPIPIISNSNQLKIHNLIHDSSDLRVQANKLLNEAINNFEKKISESKVQLGYQIGKVSSKSLKSFHLRLDSQYQLLWKSLLKEQKNQIEYLPISDFAKNIFVGGRGKRMYVENGIPFLSSSDMMLYNPKRNCKKVSKNTPGLNSMLVSKYDILISRSGTVGNTVIVGDDLSNTAISEHALKLVIDKDKILPNYVYCYLKTTHGKKCLEASSFGSVIITLNEDLIGNIDLPILDKETMSIINEKIENYISKMDLSTLKENQAIDLIEKEIELWQ
jgi:type I restriction enzyme S subunit